MTDDVIFSTIHGSKLYGLDTPNSDLDMFMVTDSGRARATHQFDFGTNTDTCTIDVDLFLTRVFEGSHQSVEALFSPYKVWRIDHPKTRLLLHTISGMKIAGRAVYEKYERTIRRFSFGDWKRRRHAVRLAQNLGALRTEGRFSPVMTEPQKRVANDLATRLEGEELWMELMNWSPRQ